MHSIARTVCAQMALHASVRSVEDVPAVEEVVPEAAEVPSVSTNSTPR